MRAARYLRVAPWDIDDTPCSRYLWGVLATYAENAESRAARQR